MFEGLGLGLGSGLGLGLGLGLVLGLVLGLGFGLELIIVGTHSLYYYAHSITPCQRLSVPYPRPSLCAANSAGLHNLFAKGFKAGHRRKSSSSGLWAWDMQMKIYFKILKKKNSFFLEKSKKKLFLFFSKS